MADPTNINIGPSFVRFKGVDLGFTKGGVEVNIITTTEASGNEQDGANPRHLFVTGRSATIKIPLIESNAQQLDRIMENVTYVDNAGVQTATISGATGADLMLLAGELVVGHLEPDGSFSGASVFTKALLMGPVKYAYKHDQERVFMANFVAYSDESQSNELMQFRSLFTI